MDKIYKCSKCNHTFKDESSDKFVKTVLKKCPVCGSSKVYLTTNPESKFAKKTNK